jgi:hypothetical protein
MLDYYLSYRSGIWYIDTVTKGANPGTGFARWMPEIQSASDVTEEVLASLIKEIKPRP